MRKVILFILCTTVIYQTFGQDISKADQLFEKADFGAALTAYETHAQTCLENRQLHEYVSCNVRMAQCHLGLGSPKSSLLIAQSTLQFAERNIANDKTLLARSKNVLGEAYLNLGRNDLALEHLINAENLLDSATLDAAECYENLGLVYTNNRNIELALQYHEKSLAVRRELRASEVLVADSDINIGLLYLIDAPRLAISYFDRALTAYRTNLGRQHPKLAYTYLNLAFAHSELKEHSDALNYIDLVEGIWESTLEGDHPNKAYTLSNRGKILLAKGDLDQSLYYQEEALKMYHKIHGEKHPDIATTYFLIGEVHLKKGKYLEAVKNHHKSIYANLFDQRPGTIYSLPEIRDYYNAEILLRSIQAKARGLAVLHFDKSLKLRDAEAALNHYVLFDELVSQVRRLRLSETDKLKLGAMSSVVYEDAIELAVYLSEKTLKKQLYLERAFNFCERSKSAVLLESINDVNAKSFAGIPEDLLQLEDSLKNEIGYIELAINQTEDIQRIEQLKSELFSYQAALRSFVKSLEDDYPKYYELKFDDDLVGLGELQSQLSAQTMVLTYLLGKRNIYVFSISAKKLKVDVVERSETFNKQVLGFRNAMRYQISEKVDELSQSLYELLVPNISGAISELIIIPDGALGTVPFEALSKEDKGTIHYLIEDYRISYDYSASLLIDRYKMESVTDSEGILLTAPVDFEYANQRLNSLPQTENEVNEIKFLFKGDERKVSVRKRGEASEEFLKSEAMSKFKYLHFATHGEVNADKPDLSRIYLTPSDDQDGSLFCGELYNMKLNAELVTLSACETGLGKVAKGEGIVGLTRALMYAGSENIVVSLWKVADQSTAQMMIDFYKNHLYHSDLNQFSDDLRKAKLNMIASDSYGAPYFWAPFILIGL